MNAGAAVPKGIRKKGNRSVVMEWADGHTSEFSARALRLECRCASCRHEWTGENLLDPTTVANDIEIQSAKVVGHYALQILFSDGHGTGIFTFENLRDACPCCATKK